MKEGVGMNKKFNFIVNLLIIILIIILVIVMMNYYMDTSVIPTIIYKSGDVDYSIGNNEVIDKIITIDKNSGETSIITPSGDTSIITPSGDTSIVTPSGDASIVIPSGDVNNNKTETNIKDTDISTKPEDGNLDSPVIITSENDISSKEKQEILSELDKTLMELLEVVDRVQIVDETRLIVDDSEVQR